MGRRQLGADQWPACTAPDCDRPAFADGLCSRHRTRLRRGRIVEVAPHVGLPSGLGQFGVLERDEVAGMVRCHECGEWFRALGAHISKAHHLSGRTYRDAHGLAANEPLAAGDLGTAQAERMRARMGTTAGRAFEASRLATLKDARARASTFREGARHRMSQASRQMHAARTLAPRLCRVCGAPVPPTPAGGYGRRVLCGQRHHRCAAPGCSVLLMPRRKWCDAHRSAHRRDNRNARRAAARELHPCAAPGCTVLLPPRPKL